MAEPDLTPAPDASPADAPAETTPPDAAPPVEPPVEPVAPPADDEDDLPPLPDEGPTMPYETGKKYREEAAARRVALREYEKQIEEIGGVEFAKQMHAALSGKDDDAAGKLTVSLLRGYGKSDDEIRAFFAGQAAAAAEAEGADEDDDRPLTVAEWKEIQRKEAEKAQQQTVQGQRAAAAAAISETLDDLKVTDEGDRAAVLALGSKLLKGETFDPAELKAAVTAGHEAWKKREDEKAKARQEEYLRGKAAQADAVPTPVTGQSPGAAGDDTEEPQSVADAIKQAKAARKAARAG